MMFLKWSALFRWQRMADIYPAAFMALAAPLHAMEVAGTPNQTSTSSTQKPDTEFARWTPFQFAVGSFYQLFPKERAVYGLGLDVLGDSESDRVAGLQLGVLGCAAGSISGSQISCIGNRSQDMAGMQVSFYNIVHGRFKGCQLGGINNPSMEADRRPGIKDGQHGYWYHEVSNHSNSQGVQLALLTNGGSSLAGMQIAGFLNEGDVTGMQIAGFLNGGDITGLQFGLIFNQGSIHGLQVGCFNGDSGNSKESHGVQLGLVNDAARISGVQFGLFNKCREFSGIQIGLWNRSGSSAWPLFRIGFGKPKSNELAKPPDQNYDP